MVHGTSVKFSSQLASVSVVFPFLCVAAGAGRIAAGLMLPTYLAGSLTGDALAPAVLRRGRSSRDIVVGGGIAIAVLLGLMALVCQLLKGHAVLLTGTFVLAAATMSIISAIGGVAYTDLVGAHVDVRHRPGLLFRRSAFGGLVAAVATVATGVAVASLSPLDGHLALEWVAAAGLLVASIVTGRLLRESAGTEPPPPAKQPGGRQGHLRALAAAPSWFRVNLLRQGLLLSTTVGASYYSAHTALKHGQKSGSLSVIVLATSLGLVLGSLLWPRFLLRYGYGRMFACGAALGACSAALALADELASSSSVATHGVVMLGATMSAQAVTSGRRAFLIERADAASRIQLASLERLTLASVASVLAIVLAVLSQVAGTRTSLLILLAGTVLGAGFVVHRRARGADEQPAPTVTATVGS